MAMQTVSFRTPSELVEALDALATREQVNRTDLLNEAIRHYLASKSGEPKRSRRVLGVLRGRLEVPADFDSMGANEVRSLFDGSSE
jgi:metal-responsive CopG/Arc/MetJ family transcriptional regulator